MDFKNVLNYRTKDLEEYNNTTDDPVYDYSKEGILIKCLPKILFKGNSIFVTFLQLIDLRLIMMFKYIDRLKNFKNISQY